MFKKFAAALIVASMLATPVLAQSMPSDTAPITQRSKPYVTKKKVTKVKAHKVAKAHKIAKAKKYATVKKYKVKKSKIAKHKAVKQVRKTTKPKALRPVRPIT